MRMYIVIIFASLALFTGQAHAQRCLPKMQGIEVKANMADGFKLGGNDGGYSLGAILSTYTKGGNKWVFGGEYLLKNQPYKEKKIPVAQFTAEGGYYLKVLVLQQVFATEHPLVAPFGISGECRTIRIIIIK